MVEANLRYYLDDLYAIIRNKNYTLNEEALLYRLELVYEILGIPIPPLRDPKPKGKPQPATLGPKPNVSKGKPGLG